MHNSLGVNGAKFDVASPTECEHKCWSEPACTGFVYVPEGLPGSGGATEDPFASFIGTGACYYKTGVPMTSDRTDEPVTCYRRNPTCYGAQGDLLF